MQVYMIILLKLDGTHVIMVEKNRGSYIFRIKIDDKAKEIKINIIEICRLCLKWYLNHHGHTSISLI